MVENLFSVIRRKEGFRDNPKSKEFRCALKMVMVSELLKPARGANCTPDSDRFVLILENLTNRKQYQRKDAQNMAVPKRNPHAAVSQLDLPEQNTMHYVGGYLCHRILSGHEVVSPCHVCRSALLASEPELHDPSLLLIHKQGL